MAVRTEGQVYEQKRLCVLVEESLKSSELPRRRWSYFGMDASVKWVDADSGLLRVAEEARDVLVDIPNGRRLGIVTVVGSARQGKSFLMNALTGSDTVFRVSPEVRPCTAGADLSPNLMPLSNFISLGSNNPRVPPVNSSDPIIGFVDMEGQGDRSAERDVVIFNWLGLPNKHTILQRLVVMIKAAEKVMDRNNEEESTFGHLVLLMRDVKGKVAEIEALVMDDEDTAGLTHDEKKDAEERNTIRQGLKDAFKSITVHTMHRPHPEISDGAVPLTEVSSGFMASLNELRGIIAGHLAASHTFGGQLITGGQRLHDIVGGLCDAVNSTEEICPPSVLEAIDARRVHEETQEALGRFETSLEYVESGSALSTQATATAIDNARGMVFELFDQATQGTCFRILKGARADLIKQMSLKSRVIAGNQEAKRRELGNKLQALVSKYEADVAKRALQWNTGVSTSMTESALQQQWDRLVSTKYGILDRDIKTMVTIDGVTNTALLTELGWALSRTQFEGLLKGTHKQVCDLNRMALAREKDRKAKEEAQKEAQQLAQENERLARERREADAQREDADRRRRVRAMQMQQLFGGGGFNPFGGQNHYGYSPYGYNPYGYGGFNPYGGFR